MKNSVPEFSVFLLVLARQLGLNKEKNSIYNTVPKQLHISYKGHVKFTV